MSSSIRAPTGQHFKYTLLLYQTVIFLWLKNYLLKIQSLLSLITFYYCFWYITRLCTGICQLRTKNTSQYNTCSQFAQQLFAIGTIIVRDLLETCSRTSARSGASRLCASIVHFEQGRGTLTTPKMIHSNAFPHLVRWNVLHYVVCFGLHDFLWRCFSGCTLYYSLKLFASNKILYPYTTYILETCAFSFLSFLFNQTEPQQRVAGYSWYIYKILLF
jgi:hypothetical protein